MNYSMINLICFSSHFVFWIGIILACNNSGLALVQELRLREDLNYIAKLYMFNSRQNKGLNDTIILFNEMMHTRCIDSEFYNNFFQLYQKLNNTTNSNMMTLKSAINCFNEDPSHLKQILDDKTQQWELNPLVVAVLLKNVNAVNYIIGITGSIHNAVKLVIKEGLVDILKGMLQYLKIDDIQLIFTAIDRYSAIKYNVQSIIEGPKYWEIIKLLTEHKYFNVNMVNIYNETPLYVAVKCQLFDAIDLFLGMPDVNFDVGENLLRLIALNGNNETIAKFINHPIFKNMEQDKFYEFWSYYIENRIANIEEVTKLIQLLDIAKIGDTILYSLFEKDNHYPSKAFKLDVLKLLLEKGVNLSVVCDDNIILMHLLKLGIYAEHVGVILQHMKERKLEFMEFKDYQNKNILNVAVEYCCQDVELLDWNVRNIKTLLEFDTLDVNNRDIKGNTSLMTAISRGMWNIVECLLDCSRVDVNLGDNLKSPISHCLMSGNQKMFSRLLENPDLDINKKNIYGETILIELFKPNIQLRTHDTKSGKEWFEILEKPRDTRGASKFKPNDLSIFRSGTKNISLHDERGALNNIELSSPTFETGIKHNPSYDLRAEPTYQPIETDFFNNRRMSMEYSSCGNFEKASLDDICKIDKPVMIDKIFILRKMLQNPKIDVNIYDNKYYTAMHYILDGCCVDLFNILLDFSGLDLGLQNPMGLSYLMIIINNIIDNNSSKQQLGIDSFGDHRGNMDKYMYMFKTLLECQNLDINQQDLEGRTALLMASGTNNYFLLQELLANKNIKVDLQDYRGNTPLIVAVQNKHWVNVINLLKAGADPYLKSFDGNTALTIAKITQHDHILSNLITKHCTKKATWL